MFFTWQCFTIDPWAGAVLIHATEMCTTMSCMHFPCLKERQWFILRIARKVFKYLFTLFQRASDEGFVAELCVLSFNSPKWWRRLWLADVFCFNYFSPLSSLPCCKELFPIYSHINCKRFGEAKGSQWDNHFAALFFLFWCVAITPSSFLHLYLF